MQVSPEQRRLHAVSRGLNRSSTCSSWLPTAGASAGSARAVVDYRPPAPHTIDDLRTPCLVLQLDVAKRNIDRMQERAATLGCVVRPHVKTHKTLELGSLQTQGSRRRIAVSTLAEAEFFAAGGFDDILYAVPITPDKLNEAAALTVALESFHIIVDNVIQLEAIFSQPAPSPHKTWSVLIMVDCGYHRDGVDPSDPVSVEIAQRLCESPTTTFAGIYTHGGHSYDADTSGGPVRRNAVVEAGEAERDVTVGFKKMLEQRGVPCPTVGVGSTPTCSAPPVHLDGVDEMHPGNYIFNDTTQSMLGSCAESDIAVKVLTRVIGHYSKQNMLLIDLGWTGCSAQGAEFGYGVLSGHPELKVVQLKQEAVRSPQHCSVIRWTDDYCRQVAIARLSSCAAWTRIGGAGRSRSF
jgi:D-serine deaminase-like pyridoxal phosphate-dependent protein